MIFVVLDSYIKRNSNFVIFVGQEIMLNFIISDNVFYCGKRYVDCEIIFFVVSLYDL